MLSSRLCPVIECLGPIPGPLVLCHCPPQCLCVFLGRWACNSYLAITRPWFLPSPHVALPEPIWMMDKTALSLERTSLLASKPTQPSAGKVMASTAPTANDRLCLHCQDHRNEWQAQAIAAFKTLWCTGVCFVGRCCCHTSGHTIYTTRGRTYSSDTGR